MSLKPRSWRVSIALSISVALVVSIFAGVVVDPPVSRDSVWDWVRSWFIGTALADGAGVPVQDGGTAAGPQAQVPAAATAADGGRGRTLGDGAGELDGYKPGVVSTRPIDAGRPVAGDGVFDAATSQRLASESDATTDVYQNADGSRTAVLHTAPVNYQTSSGDWVPADTDLVVSGNSLEPKAVGVDVSIGRSADDASLVSLAVDDKHSVSFSLAGAKDVPAKVDGDQATFSGARSQVDLVEQPTTAGVKETLLLQSASAGSSWSFPMKLEGLTARKSGNGSIELVDSKGEVSALVPAGFAKDSATPLPAQAPVRYDLDTSGGGTVLKVSVDSAWLSDPARMFPVSVDPTVATLSGWGYYETNPPASYPNQLRIGTWDSGATRTARSFLAFDGFSTQFATSKVTAASLTLFDNWAASCSKSTSFDVSGVTSAWSQATLVAPGPSISSTKVGTWSGTASSTACNNSAMTSTTGVNQTVTFNAAGVDLLNSWRHDSTTNFGLALTTSETSNDQAKVFASGAVSGHQPSLSVTYTSNTAPQVDSQYPLNNYSVQTLTPQLLAYGHDADSFPNSAVTYKFTVYDTDGTTVLATSGDVSTPNWTVPSGVMAWGKSYLWAVTTNDGDLTSANPQKYTLNVAVPQPVLTSELSQNSDERGFEPSGGNYTNADTDISIATVGPDLSVDRSYNSNDPRATGAFGAGWSSLYDAKAVVTKDSSGAENGVTLTYPDGEEVGFGKNLDGTYSPAPGRYSQFSSLGAGAGFQLVDKSGTTYSFGRSLGTGVFGLDSITDASKRKETFTFDANGHVQKVTSASGRSLTFGWATPNGATSAHVQTVSSDPVGGSPVTWTYGYTGDLLTSVCAPTTSTHCTKYSYGTDNLYPQALLNAGPASYWRLGEASGAKRAASAILANAGTDNATYKNVTLGGSTSLTGSTATTASFNGSSSDVQLLNRLALGGAFQTLAMRFKTSTANGVLFSYQRDPLTKGSTTDNYTPSLYVGGDGKLVGEFWMGHSTTAMVSSTSVTDGKWHDVVMVAVGTVQYLYLDGVQVGSLSSQIKLLSVNSVRNTYLGGGFVGGGWPDNKNNGNSTATPLWFKGSISDVAFFDRSLSAGEVAGLESRTGSVQQLTGITRPDGNTYATVSYDTTSARVSKVVDEHGAAWTLNPMTVSGSSQVFASAVLGAGPDNYWRMADASGPDVDNEVNGNLITHVKGVKANVAGRFSDSAAAQYDGSTGYSDFVPDSDDPSGTVIGSGGNQSISLWFKSSTATGVLAGYNTAALSAGTSTAGSVPLLYIGSDGKLRGEYWTGSAAPITSSAAVTDNKWHYVLLSANATGQTMYLDGATVGTLSGTVSLPASGANTHTQIGAGFLSTTWPAANGKSTPTATFFKGSIADVALYSTELTQAQDDAQWAAAAQSDGKGAVSTATTTDANGKSTSFTYDLLMGSRTLAETDRLGNQTQYGYDTGGFLYTVTDPNGNVTTTGHDVRGNTVSTKTCQNFSTDKCSTVYYTYFPDDTTLNPPADPRNDMVTSIRDGRSASASDDTYKTTYSYDSVGNQTQVTTPPVAGFPDGRTTATTYTTSATGAVGGGTTPAGLVATITTRGGKVTQFGYTAAGDLATQTDPSGQTTAFSYDALGRVTAKTVTSDTYPAGVTTSYEYDQLGQVVKETDPATTNQVTGATHTPVVTTSFDDDGNVLAQTVTDATGGDPARTSSTTYDSHDQAATTTDALGKVTSYGYDTFGNRTSVTDPNGTTTTSVFDAENRLLTTTVKGYTGDPNHPSAPVDLVVSSRAYDPAGRLANITDSMGRRTLYSYTDNGLLATVTRTDGAGASFVAKQDSYDGAGNQVQEVTNNGATTTNTTVDAAGRPTTITVDPSGLNRVTSFTYDGDDQVLTTTIADANGSRTTTSSYDATGGETHRSVTGSVSPGTSIDTSWVRDQRGLVTQMTDPSGNTTDYTNDQAGQVVSVTKPSTTVESNGGAPTLMRPATTMGYDTFGEQTQLRDPNNNVQTTGYDAKGRSTSVTAPGYTAPGTTTLITPTTRTEYDPLDQVTATIDASGARTSYTYDQLGDLASRTAADGGTTTYTYDTNGEQLSVTDPVGSTTSSTYDYMGRRATLTDQLKTPSVRNLTTTYSYGSAGWLTKTTSPAGVITSQTLNAAGEPLTATDGAGNTTSYTHDYTGQVTRATNPDNTWTTTSYDDLGNPTATADYDSDGTKLRSSTTSYSPNGQVLATTDPRGGTSTYTYDSRGLVTTETQKVDATTTIATNFGHDPDGNTTRFTDGRGNTFLTTYNSWNLPESQIEPSTTTYPNLADRTWTASYDTNGNLTSTLSPGNVTVTNTYDTLGRLTGTTGTGADAPTATRGYTWDKAGRMLTATNGTTTNTFTYDERNSLLTATGPSGNSSFNYAADGQLASRTDAAGLTSYGYDTAGRLATINDPATGTTATLAYRSMNLVDTISYGSGSDTRSFGYDKLHRLTSDTLKTSGGTTLGSISYRYDNNDNVTTKTTTGFAGAATNTYTYDLTNRLTSWNNGATTTSYGYDASGNRTSAGSTTYTYNARNQLLGDGTKTYTYTARGTQASVTQGTTTSPLTFDAYGQLATQAGASYSYDALGRMVTTTANSHTTTLSYSGTSNTLANDGTSTYTHDPAGNLLAVGSATQGAQTPLLAWTDQHDDVVGQYGAGSTSLTKSVSYDPWGTLTTANTLTGSLGFQSGWTDPASGQVNMLSRWYDPGEAQFTSRDSASLSPVPNSISANRYAYVDDDPLAGTDPSGQCSFWDLVCGVSAAWHATTSFVSHAWTATTHFVSQAWSAAKEFAHHVYDGARKVIHHVVAGAIHLYHRAVRVISDGYHYIKHAVEHVIHKAVQVASTAYHAAKHFVDGAQNFLSTTASKTLGALRTGTVNALNTAGNWVKDQGAKATTMVGQAATATGNFLSKHAAAITGMVVSTAVFMGCEGALTVGSAGTLSIPGAMVCGAAAGAAGSMAETAVHAYQDGKALTLGDLAGAAATGAIGGAIGGAGGAILGKAVTAVGAKLAGPITKLLGRATQEGEEEATQAASKAATEGAEDESGASCPWPGNSFAPGTRVLLASGKTIPIAALTVGDKVTAKDTTTGKHHTRAVAAVMVNHDTDLFDVTVRHAGTTATLHTTSGHPFWAANRHAWVRADQLTTTDTLTTTNSDLVTIDHTQATPGTADRWDLTVQTDHDFYVLAGAAPVLVHNCGPSSRSLDELSSQGAQTDRNGLTQAGRALQKHSNRPGNLSYPKVPGSQLNSAGQDVLDEILTNPMTAERGYVHPNYGPVREFLLPNMGARFEASGRLIGFL